MSRFNNVKAPNPNPGWFRWLPLRVQCLLMLLLTLPITALLFMCGVHCLHTGRPMDMGSRTPIDVGEFFFASVVGLVFSGSIFAVMMGWAKPGTPHPSETHHPRPQK